MLTLKKVAITGGIGSGKTTVGCFLKKQGAYVVSADEIVHQLLSFSQEIQEKVIQLLGQKVVEDGQLVRKEIAKKVFECPEKLKALEKMIHPKVFFEIEKSYQKALENKKNLFFVVEMPLLFESESQNFYDYTVAIVADEKKCLQRLEAKGVKKEEMEKRKKFQMAMEEKAKRADFVIYNNGTLLALEEEVKKLAKLLLK